MQILGDAAPPKAGLTAFISLVRSVTEGDFATQRLPFSIEFKAKPFIVCGGESAWGCSYTPSRMIVVAFTSRCLGTSSVAHELFHIWLWDNFGDADGNHTRTDLFVDADQEVANLADDCVGGPL